MSDLKTVREALELGNAAIDYEAGYRVMDAGLAALSRLEAQQQAKACHGRQEMGIHSWNQGHERCLVCGVTWREFRTQQSPAAPPVEPCPARKALEKIAVAPLVPSFSSGLHRCLYCSAVGGDPASIQHRDCCPASIARAALASPCSSCPRCAELQHTLKLAGEHWEETKAQIESLEAERDRLQATVKALVEGLKQIQWGNDTIDPDGDALSPTVYNLCPMCDQSEVRGHSPDCVVGALLAEHAQEKA